MPVMLVKQSPAFTFVVGIAASDDCTLRPPVTSNSWFVVSGHLLPTQSWALNACTLLSFTSTPSYGSHAALRALGSLIWPIASASTTIGSSGVPLITFVTVITPP